MMKNLILINSQISNPFSLSETAVYNKKKGIHYVQDNISNKEEGSTINVMDKIKNIKFKIIVFMKQYRHLYLNTVADTIVVMLFFNFITKIISFVLSLVDLYLYELNVLRFDQKVEILYFLYTQLQIVLFSLSLEVEV